MVPSYAISIVTLRSPTMPTAPRQVSLCLCVCRYVCRVILATSYRMFSLPKTRWVARGGFKYACPSRPSIAILRQGTFEQLHVHKR